MKKLIILCAMLLVTSHASAKCFVKLSPGKGSIIYIDANRVEDMRVVDKAWRNMNAPLIQLWFKDSMWDQVIQYEEFDQAQSDAEQILRCVK